MGACGALIGQSSADQASRGESISPDTRPMVRYARLLQIDNLVTAPDEGDSSGARYVVEMEMTMGGYQRSVSYQANRAGKPLQNNQGEYQYLETREDGARVGGNLPDVEVSDETRVRVLWQVTETDLERFAGYVDGVDRDAIAAGGKPVTIPLLDQQIMMFELEKQKSRLEGADGSTKFIEALCVLVSFFEAGSALKDKPESLENWWKMLGPTLGVLQVTFEVAGDHSMRRGLAAGGQMAYTQAARGTQYLRIGNGLRVAGAVIGIIDGFMALAEAESMARRGELRSRVRTQAFMGGLAIGGGVLALAASSLVLIPFIIGVVMLIGAYLLVKLVPNNIATWLRRSLYGKEQETFRFQPFQSMQEEQESLKMVFSGIEFDMDVVRNVDSWGGTLMPPNWKTGIRNGGRNALCLTVTLAFPKKMSGDLSINLSYQDSAGEEQHLTASKYSEGDLLKMDRHGNSIRGDDPFVSNEPSFRLEERDDRSFLIYESSIVDDGTGVLASVGYRSEVGAVIKDYYVLEFVE